MVGRYAPWRLHLPHRPRLSDCHSVGVLLTTGDWDPRRSMPEEVFGELEPASASFSLQPGQPLSGMVDLSSPEILSLAQRLQSLDLIITVDTMLAHLAGALGLPSWTLLPYDAD